MYLYLRYISIKYLVSVFEFAMYLYQYLRYIGKVSYQALEPTQREN